MRWRLQQALARAWHAHRITEGRQDDVRVLRNRDAVIDAAHGQNAHWAARSVHQLELPGQHTRKAITKNGVCMPAAHLHDLDRPVPHYLDARHQRADLGRQCGGPVAITKLIDVFHEPAPGADAEPR